jgi:hypothetical protein
VWLALAASVAFGGQGAEFLPDPTAEEAMPLHGETWQEIGPGFTVRLQLVDDGQRQAYLQRATGSATDPFASPPDKPSGYHTFLLQIENQGSGEIIFQAQNCWLTSDRNDHLYPVGMEGLRATYGMLGHELTPAYERTGSALLENSFTVLPGRQAAGLLVYRSVKPKAKRFQVELQLTVSTGDVIRLNAPYRRPKPIKNKDEQNIFF